jgi:hypothetical protein
MSHGLGDDVEIGHIFSRRRVFVLEKSDQHGFLGVSDFACIHLGTHLINAGADKLDIQMSQQVCRKAKMRITSAMIYLDNEILDKRERTSKNIPCLNRREGANGYSG